MAHILSMLGADADQKPCFRCYLLPDIGFNVEEYNSMYAPQGCAVSHALWKINENWISIGSRHIVVNVVSSSIVLLLGTASYHQKSCVGDLNVFKHSI